MKIVYVIGTMGRGGTESQLFLLMRHVKEAGLDPVLFVLEHEGDLLAEVRKLGIPVWNGGYDSRAGKALKVALLGKALMRLYRLVRRERPCIVHGFLPLANLFAALAGRLAAAPCVITSRRALNTHQERVPGWRFLDRLSTWLSHHVVANAEAVKEDTLRREGGDPEKITVIHNGIDFLRLQVATGARQQVRERLGLPPDAEVLLIVANLIPYKGHRDLLEAMALLRLEHPRLRLLVAGEDRGIGAELQEEAERLGVADAVLWLGLRRDVSELLAAADLYVSASHEEGFSNSLLEAMAAGRPVIATRVGGNPEMLEAGRLGVLVEAADPAELARAIHELLADPATAGELGQRAAQAVVTKYSPEQMVSAHLALYLECGAER